MKVDEHKNGAVKFPLLPCPRQLRRLGGHFTLPEAARFEAPQTDPNALQRLRDGFSDFGVRLRRGGAGPAEIRLRCPGRAPAHFGAYCLSIRGRELLLDFTDEEGLRAGIATLRQLLRACGRRLPRMEIRDWPDFRRRGVMLDISRGRVPKVGTLLTLVDQLADFKFNEFQLYTEHTFAYSKYSAVWRDWGALTPRDIRRLDARCRALGIDLVPNQNSFGHLRQWLEHPPLRHLAEVDGPYESEGGEFLRRPGTLAPTHPGSMRFLRSLYDEFLPCFSSRFFNVGCDETYDLGRGQSREACRCRGKGRVYLDFIRRIHREVARRNRRMMFWGDIILHYPELVRRLPKSIVAMDWGYEADHPFDKEARLFRKAGIPFYVCPGTSTWMTFVGRHDNALANLQTAARAGRRHDAVGYMITDWGDGGHPQPLAVSFWPWLAGASLAWAADSFDPSLLEPVLDRDIFQDPSGRMAAAARRLGLAHRKLRVFDRNSTPIGTALAAPKAGSRELFCWDGLNNFRRLTTSGLRAALTEIEKLQRLMLRANPRPQAAILRKELLLAARMAAESCRFMLWQQTLANGERRRAAIMARRGIRALQKLRLDFEACWPARNKAGTDRCTAFLQWRVEDYTAGSLGKRSVRNRR